MKSFRSLAFVVGIAVMVTLKQYGRAALFVIMAIVILIQYNIIRGQAWQIDFDHRFMDERWSVQDYIHRNVEPHLARWHGWEYFQMGPGDKTPFDRYTFGKEELACAPIVTSNGQQMMRTTTRQYALIPREQQ